MAKKKDDKKDELTLMGSSEIGLASDMPTDLVERLAGQGAGAMKTNMDHQSDARSLFARIAIGHGSEIFKMPPDESGNQKKPEEIQGVILDAHPYNAYWKDKNKDDGESAPPDCFSPDGITPIGSDPIAPKCASCPLNQFGSDPDGGKGKACGNRRMVHLLMEGSPFPFRLQVSPSSFKPWDEYMAMLSRKGIPRDCIITRFRLKPRKEGQYEWSELTFDVAGYVPSNEAYNGILAFRKKWIDQMREVKIEDVTEPAETTTEDTPGGYDPASGGEVIDAKSTSKLKDDDVPF